MARVLHRKRYDAQNQIQTDLMRRSHWKIGEYEEYLNRIVTNPLQSRISVGGNVCGAITNL